MRFPASFAHISNCRDVFENTFPQIDIAFRLSNLNPSTVFLYSNNVAVAVRICTHINMMERIDFH